LHFEIRRHLPDGPGPGYWPSDPVLAGWEHPSQVIWDQRVASSAGVVWARPSADWRDTTFLTTLNDEAVVVSEDGRLLGISMVDGSLVWSGTSSIQATHGVVGTAGSMLYTANRYTGRVEALHLYDQRQSGESTGSVSPLVPAWERRLDAAGSVALMPLPKGGVVASFRKTIHGVSALGRVLWTFDAPGPVLDWVRLGDQLIVSTTGEDAGLWEVDETGMSVAAIPVSGQMLALDGRLVVYGGDGLYWAGPERSHVELLHALPKRRLEQGDLVALADGGFLLTHVDRFDRRLIALNGDGTLRWQRSLSRTLRGNEYHLLMVDGFPLLVSQGRAASSGELLVLGVDLERGMLVRLFATEGWTSRPGDRWAYEMGSSRVLLKIGSGTGQGRLVALDIPLALESVTRDMTAQ
jgi:outer membrane protein assembly factor BamB